MESQPLISQSPNRAKIRKPRLHKGWFVLVLIVTAVFVVGAVFHQQIGNLLGMTKNSDAEVTWKQIEQIDSKHLPKRWEWTAECDDDTTIELTFAVKQQNLDRYVDYITIFSLFVVLCVY